MGLESPPHEGRLQEMKNEFDHIYLQEKAKGANGAIKLFNHPYKFVYNNNTASWVSENKIYKSYDIQTPWIIPEKSLYSQEVMDCLFREFEQLLDYILEKDDIKFLSTSQIAQPYREKTPHFISKEVFFELVKQIDENIKWLKSGNMILAPSEIFALMTYALKYFSIYREIPQYLPMREPLGPVVLTSCTLNEVVSIPTEAVIENIVSIDKELDFSQQLPVEIEFSDFKIPLGSAYHAFAELLKNPVPNSGKIIFRPATSLPQVAAQSGFSAQSWTKQSYPEGFTGENICIHARLQSWTFKPAPRLREQ